MRRNGPLHREGGGHGLPRSRFEGGDALSDVADPDRTAGPALPTRAWQMMLISATAVMSMPIRLAMAAACYQPAPATSLTKVVSSVQISPPVTVMTPRLLFTVGVLFPVGSLVAMR